MGLKLVVLGTVIVGILLVLPLTVAAATNTEIIAIMVEVINGILRAGEQTYCAAGVDALC